MGAHIVNVHNAARRRRPASSGRRRIRRDSRRRKRLQYANTERSRTGEHRPEIRTAYDECRGRGERVSRMPRARDSEWGKIYASDAIPRSRAFLTQLDRSAAERDRRVHASFYQPMRRTSTDRRGCLLGEFKTFPRH